MPQRRPRRQTVYQCVMCGAGFTSGSTNAKYCAECRPAAKRQREARYAGSARRGCHVKPPSLTIAECICIDRHYGLKYGEAEARGLHTREIYEQCRKA